MNAWQNSGGGSCVMRIDSRARPIWFGGQDRSEASLDPFYT
jgi:hypothetical protein